VKGNEVTNIFPFSERKAKALVAVSSEAMEQNPGGEDVAPAICRLATKQACAGPVEALAQRYLVLYGRSKRQRSATLAIDGCPSPQPGQSQFSRSLSSETLCFPDGPGRVSSESDAVPIHTPSGHEGIAHVGYSNNGGNAGRNRNRAVELWNKQTARNLPSAFQVEDLKVEP